MSDPNGECHRLKMSARSLDETVLTIIRKQAEIVLNGDSLSDLREIGADGKRVSDFEKEIDKCVEERQRAYERLVSREIDRDAYFALKTDCSERIEKLNNRIAVLTIWRSATGSPARKPPTSRPGSEQYVHTARACGNAR
jgi:hypothetical protein